MNLPFNKNIPELLCESSIKKKRIKSFDHELNKTKDREFVCISLLKHLIDYSIGIELYLLLFKILMEIDDVCKFTYLNYIPYYLNSV